MKVQKHPSPSMTSPLTSEQKVIMTTYLGAKPICIFATGPGGTGKTRLCCDIRDDKSMSPKSNPGFVLSASTGAAAELIGGMTFHRAFYLKTTIDKLETDPVKVASDLKKNADAVKVYRNMNHVIIEEVSMISAPLFDNWYTIAEILRGGRMDGVSILFMGDLLQLAPVKQRPIFQSTAWTRIFTPVEKGGFGGQIMELTICKRQDDPKFIRGLNCMRIGRTYCKRMGIEIQCIEDLISESRKRYEDSSGQFDVREAAMTHTLEEANSRIRQGGWSKESEAMLDSSFVQVSRNTAIHLYCTKVDVAAENRARLDQVPTPLVGLKANDWSINGAGSSGWEDVFRSFKAPETIHLKVGARVYLLVNKWQESMGLCHGSLGVVVGFQYNGRVLGELPPGLGPGERIDPVVKFFNGQRLAVPRVEFKYERGGRKIASRIQTPLALAWATTVHHAQGATFEAAILHLSRLFADAHAYVSFSRVKSQPGLFLDCPGDLKVEPPPEALEYCHDRGLLTKMVASLREQQQQLPPPVAVAERKNLEKKLSDLADELSKYECKLVPCSACSSKAFGSLVGCEACWRSNSEGLAKIKSKAEKPVPMTDVESSAAERKTVTAAQRARAEANRQAALERLTLAKVRARVEANRQVALKRLADNLKRGRATSEAEFEGLFEAQRTVDWVHPDPHFRRMLSNDARPRAAAAAAAAAAEPPGPYDIPLYRIAGDRPRDKDGDSVMGEADEVSSFLNVLD